MQLRQLQLLLPPLPALLSPDGRYPLPLPLPLLLLRLPRNLRARAPPVWSPPNGPPFSCRGQSTKVQRQRPRSYRTGCVQIGNCICNPFHATIWGKQGATTELFQLGELTVGDYHCRGVSWKQEKPPFGETRPYRSRGGSGKVIVG